MRQEDMEEGQDAAITEPRKTVLETRSRGYCGEALTTASDPIECWRTWSYPTAPQSGLRWFGCRWTLNSTITSENRPDDSVNFMRYGTPLLSNGEPRLYLLMALKYCESTILVFAAKTLHVPKFDAPKSS